MKRWCAVGLLVPQMWLSTPAHAGPARSKAPAEKVLRQGPAKRQLGHGEILGKVTLYADVLAFEPTKKDQVSMRVMLADIEDVEVSAPPWGGEGIRLNLRRGTDAQQAFGAPLVGLKEAAAWKDAIERAGFKSGAMPLKPRTPGKAVTLGDAAFSLPTSWNVFSQDEVTATNSDGTLSVWVYQRDAAGAAALDALARKPPPLPGWEWETKGKSSVASPGKGAKITEYVGIPGSGVRAYFHYAVVGSPGGKALLFLVKGDEAQKEPAARVLQDFLASVAFAP